MSSATNNAMAKPGAAVPNPGGEDLHPVAVSADAVSPVGTVPGAGTGAGVGADGALGPEVPGSAAGASTGHSAEGGLLQKAQAMAQPVRM